MSAAAKKTVVNSEGEDDFKYEEVSLEDEWSLTEGEEDLEATVKAIQHRAEADARRPNAVSSGTHRPETVVDFLRNFLFQTGMRETLDCFQTEWTEMMETGQVDAEQVGVVSEVYTDNQRLDSELRNARREMEDYRRAASVAAETLVRVQRSRDFHRLQHKRVVQEKNRLIEEMRKLKLQCNSHEPAVKRMNEKYQAALKQVMVLAVERDRALGQENKTEESGVRETACPVVQPRPPPSPAHPRRLSRVHSVKANVS